ncbi:MAG TPA: GNAT family N-acetyltransferase [Gemmatimonadaceae bacterium]|nr:GNAT family N-acetyltransferase [Gemmatimonadaceae bacterium]
MATGTAPDFAIRRCSSTDAAMLAELGARLFTEAYGPTHPEPELSRYLARSFSIESVRDAINDETVTMLVAEDFSSRPIGYAFLKKTIQLPEGVDSSNSFEIVRFYVAAAAQGRGVGAALMEECLEEARRRDADTVWLQVWKEAPWAVRFYKRMGFAAVGSAPFYFGDQIGDDHIMSRAV